MGGSSFLLEFGYPQLVKVKIVSGKIVGKFSGVFREGEGGLNNLSTWGHFVQMIFSVHYILIFKYF